MPKESEDEDIIDTFDSILSEEEVDVPEESIPQEEGYPSDDASPLKSGWDDPDEPPKKQPSKKAKWSESVASKMIYGGDPGEIPPAPPMKKPKPGKSQSTIVIFSGLDDNDNTIIEYAMVMLSDHPMNFGGSCRITIEEHVDKRPIYDISRVRRVVLAIPLERIRTGDVWSWDGASLELRDTTENYISFNCRFSDRNHFGAQVVEASDELVKALQKQGFWK